MESFLIKEQYKVIRVLKLEEHYAALQAVDVTSRSNEQYILNVYDGPLVKQYAGVFHDLRNCTDYAGMFVRDESLAAVFRYQDGREIDRCFYRGDNVDSLAAVGIADCLFRETLAISDFPPAVSCAMLFSDQLMYRETEHSFVFRPVIVPTEEMNERELALLLADQIRKILHTRFGSSEAARKYLCELSDMPYRSVVQMYSGWCERKALIEEEERKLIELGFFPRMVRLTWINIKDLFRRMMRKSKEERL